jgi:hypothetical protein
MNTPAARVPVSRTLTVELAHAPNPDIQGGGYWEGVPPEGVRLIPVSSVAEASQVCREFLDQWGLGGGNWTGGDVRENGTVVARISYNGRAWNTFPWGHPDHAEIPIPATE